MNEKTATKQKPASGRATYNGGQGDHHPAPAGIDLPVLGHVPYTSIGFFAGLGAAGVVGAIEWPVVAAVGIGYALARR